jgi:hypothetical protein
VRWVLASTACCALLAGCGGAARQDADEPDRAYDVQVTESRFPASQSISRPAKLRIAVRNTGHGTVPDLSVSLDGLSQASRQPGLADPWRPVWIVDRQPSAGQTAYVYTWAVGPLAAGRSRTLEWTLSPAVPGTHTLTWTVAAGLNGRAKAHTRGGRPPTGTFTIHVDDVPAPATVDPDTGAVVR